MKIIVIGDGKVGKAIIEHICKEGHLEVQFETDERSQLIAKTMLVQLKTIEDNYQKYIKIKVQAVRLIGLHLGFCTWNVK